MGAFPGFGFLIGMTLFLLARTATVQCVVTASRANSGLDREGNPSV